MRVAPTAVALLMLLSPATALGVGCMRDPVVTYTNGMLLPSATPERSHNVYWRCDPYHLGECGGRYNRPVCNSLMGYVPPRGPSSGAGCPSEFTAGVAGAAPVDPTQFEKIGVLPAPSERGR